MFEDCLQIFGNLDQLGHLRKFSEKKEQINDQKCLCELRTVFREFLKLVRNLQEVAAINSVLLLFI